MAIEISPLCGVSTLVSDWLRFGCSLIIMRFMNDSDTSPGIQEKKRRGPLVVPVQVQCEGYRCLAFQDHEGKWVDYCSGQPLTGTVRVVPEPVD